MPARDLSSAEISGILEQQRVVRIAFSDKDSCYIVPLGYVWLDDTICCITSEGRKVQLVKKDDHVSFQVDTSAETGPYNWKSVTGQGVAEIVADPAELARVFPLLMARFSEMPEWARAEFAVKHGESQYMLLRIIPVKMTGRSCEKPAG